MSPEATTNLLGVTSLRVVIRPHINHTVAQKLGHDIVNACRYLEEYGGNATPPKLHAHAAEKTPTEKC
jgi:glutamate decarboxylase